MFGLEINSSVRAKENVILTSTSGYFGYFEGDEIYEIMSIDTP